MLKRKQQGYNFIELFAVVLIVAILAGLGIPSLTATLDRRSIAAEADRLVRSINFARSEAVNKQLIVGLEGDAGTNWSGGWTVYTTTDNLITTAFNPLVDTMINTMAPAGKQASMNSSVNRIKYNRFGRLIGVPVGTTITIAACDAAQSLGFNGSLITINAFGRASVTDILPAGKAGTC